MSGPLADPVFWYGVAFAIFVALAVWKGRKPVLTFLDGEIIKISSELARVKQLRFEAESLLAEYRKKHAEAMAEAKDIIRYAREEAEDLRKQAEDNLNEMLLRHEQQAAERIRLAEAEALSAVRKVAVETAMSLARTTLAQQVANTGKLADQAIAELPTLASSRAP